MTTLLFLGSDVTMANFHHWLSFLYLSCFCHCCIGNSNTKSEVTSCTLRGTSREQNLHFPFSILFKAKVSAREQNNPNNNTLSCTLLNFCIKNSIRAAPTGQIEEQGYGVAEVCLIYSTLNLH